MSECLNTQDSIYVGQQFLLASSHLLSHVAIIFRKLTSVLATSLEKKIPAAQFLKFQGGGSASV